MSLSNYAENEILDHVLGGGDYPRPGTVYISLHTDDPGETGAAGEISGGGYARAAVTNNATNFPAAVNGAKANGTVITFATPTGDWGEITHGGIWDAPTGGNCLGSGALGTPKTINNGDTVTIPISGLSITLN